MRSAGRPADVIGAAPALLALTAAVDEVVGLVRGAEADLRGGQDSIDLLLGVRAQLDRLVVASSCLAVTVDADGWWALEGARSFSHWLAASSGLSVARAREVVATGRALREHLPATARAAFDGEIGAEQAVVVARLAPTSDARRAALAAPAEECGEGFLTAQAKVLPVGSFRRLVQRWAAAADPEADERGYRDACDREHVTLSTTTGGVHLAGFLTSEHGALLSCALDSVTTPPAPDDRRSTPQRRAQALADVARLCLDHGLTGTGAAVRPHVSCVVDFETLRRAVGADRAGRRGAGRRGAGGPGADDAGVVGTDGAGVVGTDGTETAGAEAGGTAGAEALGAEAGGTDGVGRFGGSRRRFRLPAVADVERFAVAEVLGSGPVPPSVLARLACDSEISRIVFGPDSQVINAGRAERTFSGPRRRAVIARDGTCRYPGCSAPPALCEVHHVDGWVARRGETDVNRGVLLCWHHHDVVHRRSVRIESTPGGGFGFRTRHGTPVAGAP
ncbi:HNH endonuclease signature motif containing protein [Cellulomonas sp. SG140]|uniref:HNH endonuclease signature motif containing protein n=1 Tax=Cellulomonas sp. SG140 TaxID=2976536 RepID=UPI0021E96A88|nr:HNH endonuclease signature motif containing protein [Cellulomonas sp. SG140]